MGDTANVRAWQKGEVFVAPKGTSGPTDVTTPLAATWKTLGILEQDAGAEEGREETKSEVFGWGTGLARTLFSKHKRSIKVSALETNATVLKLANPGSTATTAGGVTTFTVKNPTHVQQAFVVEETDGAITRRRIIKAAYASVTGTIKDSETGVTTYEVTIDVTPDATTNEIWTEVSNDPAMVDLTSA